MELEFEVDGPILYEAHGDDIWIRADLLKADLFDGHKPYVLVLDLVRRVLTIKEKT